MGVALLRTPVAMREAALPVAFGVRPAPSAVPVSRESEEEQAAEGVRPRRDGAAVLRLWWANGDLVARCAAALGVLLVYSGIVRSSLSAARARAQTVSRESLALAYPRLLPHSLVIAAATVAVLSGGFSRPQDVVASLIGIGSEQGELNANGRFVLGPRAAEVPVRDALVRPASATTSLAPAGPRAEIVTYKVQPGDTVWDIGARFNIGWYSVMWSNGLDEDAIIKPGQDLRIPPVSGAIYSVKPDDDLDSIAKKYSVDPAAIVDFNGLRPGEGLPVDKMIVIPGGQLPVVRRVPVAPPPPPVAVARPGSTVQAPPRALPLPAPVAPPTGRFSWPARGLITTYFSSWHPGIDVAAALGTAIGAADGGTVTFTGWDNTGYGYRVVINHGNGYSTTYNHLSSIGVRTGQSVSKGQIVAGMGSTGRSTGSHLHFEILRNGSFVNPLSFLG